MMTISYASMVLIGMVMLTAWGIASAVYGSGYKKVTDVTQRSCRQMTLFWGIINTVLGLSAVIMIGRSFGLYGSDLPTQQHAQNLFQFNALLDLGYITVGSGLAYLGKNVSKQRRGYGLAIAVQGLVLLIIDLSLSLVRPF